MNRRTLNDVVTLWDDLEELVEVRIFVVAING